MHAHTSSDSHWNRFTHTRSPSRMPYVSKSKNSLLHTVLHLISLSLSIHLYAIKSLCLFFFFYFYIHTVVIYIVPCLRSSAWLYWLLLCRWYSSSFASLRKHHFFFLFLLLLSFVVVVVAIKCCFIWRSFFVERCNRKQSYSIQFAASSVKTKNVLCVCVQWRENKHDLHDRHIVSETFFVFVDIITSSLWFSAS